MDKPEKMDLCLNPLPVIYSHFTLKGLQLGQALMIPCFLYSTIYRRSLYHFFRTLRRNLLVGSIAGVAAVNAGGHYKITNDPKTNAKRQFLLQRNIRQNLIDDMMVVGMLAGTFVSVVIPVRLTTCMLFGGFLGTSAYMTNYNVLSLLDSEFDFKKYL